MNWVKASGTVVSLYSMMQVQKLMKSHNYDDEDEHCYFDITIDLVNGDLKVLDE